MNVKIANRIKFWITTAVSAVMVYALIVSASHIIHVAQTIGVPGWQAKTSWILVDLPALIGKVLQLKVFSSSTRKAGRGLTYFSGSLSLACNIASGLILGSWGAAGWGAFVAMMFLVLETVVTRIKPAAGVTRAKNRANGQTELRTPNAPAAVTHVTPVSRGRKCADGCVCARHKSRNAVRDLEVSYQMPSAPVSGA